MQTVQFTIMERLVLLQKLPIEGSAEQNIVFNRLRDILPINASESELFGMRQTPEGLAWKPEFDKKKVLEVRLHPTEFKMLKRILEALSNNGKLPAMLTDLYYEVTEAKKPDYTNPIASMEPTPSAS